MTTPTLARLIYDRLLEVYPLGSKKYQGFYPPPSTDFCAAGLESYRSVTRSIRQMQMGGVVQVYLQENAREVLKTLSHPNLPDCVARSGEKYVSDSVWMAVTMLDVNQFISDREYFIKLIGKIDEFYKRTEADKTNIMTTCLSNLGTKLELVPNWVINSVSFVSKTGAVISHTPDKVQMMDMFGEMIAPTMHEKWLKQCINTSKTE